jgi:hypothetical protein
MPQAFIYLQGETLTHQRLYMHVRGMGGVISSVFMVEQIKWGNHIGTGFI